MALEAYGGNLRMFDALMGMIKARTAFGGEVVVIAAAGNDSQRDQDPNFEIATGLPAAADGVISVGALAQSPNGLKVAPFSNTLPQISTARSVVAKLLATARTDVFAANVEVADRGAGVVTAP